MNAINRIAVLRRRADAKVCALIWEALLSRHWRTALYLLRNFALVSRIQRQILEEPAKSTTKASERSSPFLYTLH